MPTLPNPLIGAVASILSEHYYSHRQIDNLFTGCQAPGTPPAGNLAEKIIEWLPQSADPFTLGLCARKLYGFEHLNTTWLKRRGRVIPTKKHNAQRALLKNSARIHRTQ